MTVYFLYIDVDAFAKRIGDNRDWVIGDIDIRAEIEFRAHSQSYLKITARDISSF
jgi:hypothetical protein